MSIKHYSHACNVQSVYNIRLTEGDITPQLETIFSAQSRAFKINASVGLTLRHNSRGDFRYFHASNNNYRMFSEPILVQSRDDFQEFINAISDKDFTENVLPDSEDSQWIFHDVNNVSIYVNHLDFPIRANTKNRGKKAKKAGVLNLSTDHNACFFYCLAAHKNPQKVKNYVTRKHTGPIRLVKDMKSLFHQYTSTPLEEFAGVTMLEMDRLEKAFNVGVQIYNLTDNNGGAYLIRRANPNYSDIMHLDLSDDGVSHFRYIHNLHTYAPFFRCGKCSQLWKYRSHCARHEATCNTQTKRVYPDEYL